MKKIRDFPVDEKIDVSPLIVGDKLYVFTMTNTAYVFDVNTGAELVKRPLAAPFDPADIANPLGKGMDLHNMYRNWGITATPVIDVATNTLYVTTFGKPNAVSQNTERNNMLRILDANTLADKKPPVLIGGNADNGGGEIANGFTTPYQKMRAGLGLLTNANGNKAVVVSFSINGENPNGPGHGFVVAYDVRGLNRDPGFAPTPAIWNVTPGGGAGGVWMSGSGPAIDGDDIYLATGNGMDPGTKPDNFAESFVKLRYTAGVSGLSNGKPTLAVIDYWGAFSDFERRDKAAPQDREAAQDQDLGSAGVVLIPARGNLIGGGKDGILYNLNKDNLGKNKWDPHFNLPFVATYLPDAPNGPAGLPTTTVANPNWPIVNLDRNLPAQTPAGKSYHIHEAPCTWNGRTAEFCLSGARTSASRLTITTLPRSASRPSAPKACRWHRETIPVCLAAASSFPPTGASGHGRCLGHVPGARRRELQGRSWRSCRVRRDAGRQRQVEAAFSQQTRRVGVLRQVLHTRSGEREGLCRDVQQQGRSVRPLMRRPVRLVVTYVQRRSERETAVLASFDPEAVESRAGGHTNLHPQEADGQAPFKTKLAGCSSNDIMALAVLALVAWTIASHAQTGDTAAPTAPVPQQQSAALEGAAPAGDGLSDLNAVTFSCVRAGLNAAGREAAKAKSQGTYQFSYFKIIKDTHHSFYEVHFKSNYSGEPDLKYCVAIYCQQGWDPKATQISVRPMSNERQVQVAAHGADCGNEQTPVKHRAKR